MRKAFLLGGLVLLCTSTALAGQRTRAGAIRDGEVSSDSKYLNAREIAPGVMTVEINGAQLTVNADGTVELEAIILEFGSPEAYMRELVISQIVSAPNQNGDGMIYANGMMPHTREDVGALAPTTVEDHKTEVPFATQTIGGVDILAFADGAIAATMSAEQPVNRAGHASARNGSDTVWDDGVVAFE